MKYKSLVCALIIISTALSGDELERKKQELERQIQELEAKQQRQNEINDLEKRLQELQATQQPQQSDEKPQPSYTHQPPQQPSTQAQSPLPSENYRKGALVGIGIGAMGVETSAITQVGLTYYQGNLSGEPFMPSGRVGYQHFSSNESKIGSRFYIDFGYGIASTESEDAEMTQSLWSLNLDALLDMRIPNTNAFAGVIVGVGYGRLNYKSQATYDLGFSQKLSQDLTLSLPTPFVNVGLSMGITKHRLEVYAKIPTTSEYNEAFYYKATTPLVSVLYQYTF